MEKCKCIEDIYDFKKGNIYDYEIINVDYNIVYYGIGNSQHISKSTFKYFIDLKEHRNKLLKELLK